ncbi:MAG: DUF6762 family protein [Clostridiaceae bacterium]
MDFSSLVLIERDKENNFVGEMDSFNVGEGAQYITKFYYDGEIINVIFDTKTDVEEWEFSAIFDNFNTNDFIEKGYSIEEIDDEYNPTYKVTFEYKDDYQYIGEKLNEVCDLIKTSMEEVFDKIKDLKEDYI